ncbi:MAG: S8 family serine peptidase [Ascidiaceihabitans sp.]|uniref:S8 family peptidase n=1 Tax=Ascidiaceihabitans sp. TaxID=1872644 RepID=UPI00329803F6
MGGLNCVKDEDPNDFQSNGDPHGTHVAGLVGANGPMKGTAPSVNLMSYRVFAKDGSGATNFAILKAVAHAVENGCDFLNMSLGVDGDDPALAEAITHARNEGSLVLAAGNNSHGGDVGSPSNYADCIGISAVRRTDVLPVNAQAQQDITASRGTSPDTFFAAFSCIGNSLNITGPGVGVVSTVPGGYGQLSGTSMACPTITGFAAQLLASNPTLMKADRTRKRSDEMAKILMENAQNLGLPADQQGRGLPFT